MEQLRRNPETRALPLIIHTTIDLSNEQTAQLELGPSRFITKTKACSYMLGRVIHELLPEKAPVIEGTP